MMNALLYITCCLEMMVGYWTAISGQSGRVYKYTHVARGAKAPPITNVRPVPIRMFSCIRGVWSFLRKLVHIHIFSFQLLFLPSFEEMLRKCMNRWGLAAKKLGHKRFN